MRLCKGKSYIKNCKSVSLLCYDDTWMSWVLQLLQLLNMQAIRRLVKIFCQEPESVKLGCLRLHTQFLTGVLQFSLPARCRLEVTSGTIRERRLPRVCQWNMRPDTSASSWLGLFLPCCSWEVWKGDTPMLTLLCPTCHLTFMLDVSSPATAIQSPQPWHQNSMQALFKVVTSNSGGKEKQSQSSLLNFAI